MPDSFRIQEVSDRQGPQLADMQKLVRYWAAATTNGRQRRSAIARHWIDGRWRDSAQHKDSIDPATGEVLGRYALAGEDEAREAVAAPPHVLGNGSPRVGRRS